jgi:DTW domain-containing protein YfiP
VPEARVVIYPPRTVADLIRRRVRTATGLAQMRDKLPAASGTHTSWGSLRQIVRQKPALAPKVVVFLAVATVARYRARRHVRAGDFQTWLRDESSRQA